MREKIVLVRVPLGGSMEPCCPEIFVVRPGAQSLSQPCTTRSMYVKNPVKKCVKNVSFSHTFHMFFIAFHMYFMHIFHMCVKFSIVKYM